MMDFKEVRKIWKEMELGKVPSDAKTLVDIYQKVDDALAFCILLDCGKTDEDGNTLSDVICEWVRSSGMQLININRRCPKCNHKIDSVYVYNGMFPSIKIKCKNCHNQYNCTIDDNIYSTDRILECVDSEFKKIRKGE